MDYTVQRFFATTLFQELKLCSTIWDVTQCNIVLHSHNGFDTD